MTISADPAVTVITPAFNAERYIGAAMGSVMAQTFPSWEMIVVDDCSSDGTWALVSARAEQEKRIRCVRMPTNSGSGPARNAALELARGRFVAFLDADDLWDEEKLDRQLRFMRTSGHAFTFTGYRVISESGKALGSAGPFPASIGYKEMLVEQPGCLTVMLDRDKLGQFRFPPFRRNQDGALWLSLLRSGTLRAFGLDEELASYRAVPASISANKFKSALAVWQVMRRQERIPLLTAMSCFARYALRGTRKHLATRARQ
jgi:teichuronic acid biosynthesis glycosyltransferase TuaG